MIYFDNAATSLHKPEQVGKAMLYALNHFGNASRGAHEHSLNASREIFSVRLRLAQLFNIKNPLNIAFTLNITEALNAVINSCIASSHHVITTAAEHNSTLRPLYKSGADISIVPCDELGLITFSDFKKSLKKNTKAIICSHASNVTGNVLNIAEIGNFCRTNGLLFILDSAQTAGALEIDIKKSLVDIVCFTGHKSLLGPQGVGGIGIDDDCKIELHPFKSGGSGFDSFNMEHPQLMPDCFEAGTLPAPAISGLGGALEFIQNTGIYTINTHLKALTDYFYNNLSQFPNIKIYGDFKSKPHCPVISFNISTAGSDEICTRLAESYNIAARSGIHCAPLIHTALNTKKQGAVRFSFSYFNTKHEIHNALIALREIADSYS